MPESDNDSTFYLPTHTNKTHQQITIAITYLNSLVQSNLNHKRSHVETPFHMIKSKFGDSLRSKTKTAQINEALCKVLCHNICCLIQSMYELNLKPKFWAEAA